MVCTIGVIALKGTGTPSRVKALHVEDTVEEEDSAPAMLTLDPMLNLLTALVMCV